MYETHAAHLVEQTSLGRLGARKLRGRADERTVADSMAKGRKLPPNALLGRTKVLLTDDHDLIRKGLRHVFERDRQFEVVGEAATAAESVRQAGRLSPM